jgi:hypothetical protein
LNAASPGCCCFDVVVKTTNTHSAGRNRVAGVDNTRPGAVDRDLKRLWQQCQSLPEREHRLLCLREEQRLIGDG